MKDKWIFLWYSIFMITYFLLNMLAKYYVREIFFILPFVYLIMAIAFCIYFGAAGQKGKEKAAFYYDYKRQLWFLGLLLLVAVFSVAFSKSFLLLCDSVFLLFIYIGFLLCELFIHYMVVFWKTHKRFFAVVLFAVFIWIESNIYYFLYVCLFSTCLIRIQEGTI